MSDMLIDKIKEAKASCDKAFEVMNDKFQDLEAHYSGFCDQLESFKARLNQIGELSTTSDECDLDNGINNPEIYFWKCKF